MLCGFCRLKDIPGKYGCPKIKKFIRNKSPACNQFIFNPKKISPALLKKALELNKLPRTQIMALICLLDSSLMLRAQGLDLGLSAPFVMTHGKQKKKFQAEAFLLSAPKRKKEAEAVAFTEDGLVAFSLPKEIFYKSLDAKLVKVWDLVETKVLSIKSDKVIKKVFSSYVTRMDKKFLLKTFRLKRIPIKSLNKKGILNELCRLYER